MELLLELRNLSTTLCPPHARPVPVVRDLSLTLERGKVLAILGESGSGKSMAIKSILRILPGRAQMTGEVRFGDKNLLTLPERAMANLRGDRIAVVCQDPMSSLDPVFTVGAQIVETLRRHRRLGHREAWELAVEELARLGVPAPAERMHDYPHQLSGGMCQRVMIAMALACQPDVLLADEPTSALDVTVQAQILTLLDSLRRDPGLGLVLVTHDVGVAAAIADEVAVMYAGQIVEYGPVSEVLRRPRHPYTAGLIDANVTSEHEGPLRPIPGQPPLLAYLPSGCAFAERCAYAVHGCSEREPRLAGISAAVRHDVRCLRVHEEGLHIAESETAGVPA